MSRAARQFEDDTWLTTLTEYAGQPIALRVRPAADSAVHRAQFPHLLALSHELAHITSNGLPEAAYNDSLADFDEQVHAALEKDGNGLVVLVETFSGKRVYYVYVADTTRAAARGAELGGRYPEHDLRLRYRHDTDWKLFNTYRELFSW